MRTPRTTAAEPSHPLRVLPHDPRKLAAIYAGGVAGALLLGIVAGVALESQALVIVAGGGIGSFTTFSTWILDSHRLERVGETDLAWINLGLPLIAGFAAVALGHWLGGLF
jgi:CrcB protein